MLMVKKYFLVYLSIFFAIAVAAATNHGIRSASQTVSLKYVNDSKYSILIYIEEKRLYLIENNKCIKDYPIASGKSGWPSPIGQWKIVEKGDWGEGFGGYWLGLDVTWGRYGIHGTLKEYSIGRAVSHGCIRMYNNDVKELYNIVPVGTPVVINGGPFGPVGAGFRFLTPGDRGADVLEVQKKLKELGYFKGKVSGIYEDDLKNALYEFQKDKQLAVKYTITDEDYKAMGLQEFE
jgi:hypothetical protein